MARNAPRAQIPGGDGHGVATDDACTANAKPCLERCTKATREVFVRHVHGVPWECAALDEELLYKASRVWLGSTPEAGGSGEAMFTPPGGRYIIVDWQLPLTKADQPLAWARCCKDYTNTAAILAPARRSQLRPTRGSSMPPLTPRCFWCITKAFFKSVMDPKDYTRVNACMCSHARCSHGFQ